MKNQFRIISGTYPPVYYHADDGKFKTVKEEIPVINGKVKLSVDGNDVEQCAILTALRAFKIAPRFLSLNLLEGDMIDAKDGYKLSNLYYRHRELIEYEEGFYYIPYYETMVINRKGKCLNWVRGNLLKSHVSKPNIKRNIIGGYHSYCMVDNFGLRKNIGRHRLLCLTFKRYDTAPKRLHVNHEDGIPGNDDLDNLSWCTPKENIDHAIENGLKLTTVKVLHKDLNTGKITKYMSAQRCALALGKAANFYNVILYRMRKCPGTVFPDGWLFKEDDGSEWPPLKEGIARQSNYNPVLAMDVFTREITKFDNASKAAKHYGLKGDSITSHIRNDSVAPLDGKVFRYADKAFWPKHTKEQLLTYSDYPFKPPYGLRHTDGGKITYYTSVRKASEQLGISIRAVRTLIEKDDNYKLISPYVELGPDYQK